MARTRDFAEVIKKELAADRELADSVSEVAFHASVADQIYNARIEAGLTQSELARQIGSQQSVIARLEDADYEGHSISMLTRICNALGKELHVVFKDRSYASPPAMVVASTSIAMPGFRWARLIQEEFHREITINQPTIDNYEICEQGTAA